MKEILMQIFISYITPVLGLVASLLLVGILRAILQYLQAKKILVFNENEKKQLDEKLAGVTNFVDEFAHATKKFSGGGKTVSPSEKINLAIKALIPAVNSDKSFKKVITSEDEAKSLIYSYLAKKRNGGT